MIRLYKNKKIVIDILLNITATALPLIVMQLAILPLMAQTLVTDDYALLLAIASLVTIVSTTLGNSLNNVRLLNDSEYNNKNYAGDFNLLLIIETILNIILISFGIFSLSGRFSLINLIGIIFFSILTVAREYYVVNFRLQLNYFAIVWNNVYMTVGYLLGYFAFKYTGYWILPYLVGTLLSFLHVAYKNNLLKEGLRVTALFKNSFYKTSILFFAGILSNTLSYSDRMIIYPMIGSTAVAIYYASSFLGKIVTAGITPVASVILSYLSKKDKLPQKHFKLLIAATLLVGVVAYFVGVAVSKPLLFLLYPQWIGEAVHYIKITTFTAIIIMFTNVVKPFALKYCNINWQIIINLIPFIIYIVLAILFYRLFGLYGFCLGVLISNIIKCGIFIIIVFKQMRNTVEANTNAN